MAVVIETVRLRLRDITLDDAEFIFRLVNEPSFLMNIGDKGVRDLDDARRFVQEGYWTNQRKPGYGQFLVELREGGVPAGICGLLYREILDLTDVGFAFLPEHWGRGFAFEAAEAVIRYGYSTLKIKKIVALTSPGNLASIRVLQRLGMAYERTVKMSESDPGTTIYS
jgi:RimJ/RimL family protein N-acetyltransferase